MKQKIIWLWQQLDRPMQVVAAITAALLLLTLLWILLLTVDQWFPPACIAGILLYAASQKLAEKKAQLQKRQQELDENLFSLATQLLFYAFHSPNHKYPMQVQGVATPESICKRSLLTRTPQGVPIVTAKLPTIQNYEDFPFEDMDVMVELLQSCVVPFLREIGLHPYDKTGRHPLFVVSSVDVSGRQMTIALVYSDCQPALEYLHMRKLAGLYQYPTNKAVEDSDF